jgi:hypothetical protein
MIALKLKLYKIEKPSNGIAKISMSIYFIIACF